jgi:hypothetical protein
MTEQQKTNLINAIDKYGNPKYIIVHPDMEHKIIDLATNLELKVKTNPYLSVDEFLLSFIDIEL